MFHNLSYVWSRIQNTLFPELEEVLPPLTEMQKKLVAIFEVIHLEIYAHILHTSHLGRPKKDRIALVQAFIAKAVYNLSTTRTLIDQLLSNPTLRRLCGWEYQRDIPSESTFSRAFAEFAQSDLPAKIHEKTVKVYMDDHLVGHISRDSTAIKAQEKPAPKGKNQEKEPKKPKKRGRPKKGEEPPTPEPTRLEKQTKQTLEEMVDDLPRKCNRGTKKNSNGYKISWNGYKLHLDVDDNDIPISAILTSASLHDSQVAIPLSTMTAQRVINLYDLMDAAYDAEIIIEHSLSLGHVPIIDQNPRKDEKRKMDPPQAERYKIRSTVERVNGRLKQEYGACMLRVRGASKVFTHLMFGVLALTAHQLLNIVK